MSVIFCTAIAGKLKPIPADSGHKVGYTLDRVAIHYRADTIGEQLITLSFTPLGNKTLNMQTHTESHSYSTQESNPGPFAVK